MSPAAALARLGPELQSGLAAVLHGWWCVPTMLSTKPQYKGCAAHYHGKAPGKQRPDMLMVSFLPPIAESSQAVMSPTTANR